ncbi:hypothetical protein BKE38_10960 [Pseudoroseomonas deserti]|uniref:Response regulatory domain-containing protein n=2 Tax=Teichococcus deserti TaxID=1817963 RepID=A0A1V2H427_9PROT|nr:hypothetical protein BKE38_10960 [Pseudoroseomonas deserti]
MMDKLHAVVAEDDMIIRLDAAQILEDAGFKALQARDADAALALIAEREGQIHVLFTDVQMAAGSMNGFQLALKVAQSWSHIRIVVASGNMKPKAGDLPDQARFINKPFSAQLVHSVLKEMLPEEEMPMQLKQKPVASSP